MPFGWFLPKEYSFFDLFERQAALCCEATKALAELCSAPDQGKQAAARIKEIERQGDDNLHKTVEALHKTFITPIDRDEIHKLIEALDDVLDSIEAATRRYVIFELTEVKDEAKELSRILTAATDRVAQATKRLRTMSNPEALFEDCHEINRLENEADDARRRGLARLFREHHDEPVEIIKWMEVYQYLEAAADSTEDVANIIEGIVLEHA